MQLHDRVIVQQPPGLEPTLAHAATDTGAWAMIDTTRPGWQDQLEDLPRDQLVLRVTPATEPIPEIGLAMVTTQRLAHRDIDELQRSVRAWQAHGVPVAVEVRSKAEGRRAKDAGADLLVARGAEGPGRASSRSNLVLLPALADLDLPIIAWGGAGPNATGALLVHAEMVVLDAQLYLLPEAGLDEAWHRALSAFDGSDVKALGSTLDEPVYLHARVAHQAVHDLWEQEQAATDEGQETRRRRLDQALDGHLAGFDVPPGQGFHPLGHDAAHATAFAQHGSLEAALAALEARVADQLAAFPLREGAPLAESHGTQLPVVQGAMANVSEVPAFAKAVSDAGGLPFLAFAALREHWAEEALVGTKEALDGASFGCGIIGLDVNAKKRDAHIRILKEHTPPIALIAAGTAEQALDLEQAGIDTYLHTPSQGIVQQALDMGLDRIVVEGNECGGHIGKLPSLVLWDQALQAADTGDRGDGLHVLLAGGISDQATAAMAGTLAAGLDHVKIGVLMGTAYLATREIVETGAITEAYQRLVLASKTTDVTGETVGIRARSAPTPFTEKITGLERELVRQGRPLDERKEVLENENLGATRTAARGVKRADDGTYHDVPTEEQLADGNYLMGQGAELLEQVTTIEELHARVTSQAEEVQAAARDRIAQGLQLPSHARSPREQAHEPAGDATDASPGDRTIAIVGLGCVLPDAPDIPTFWQNVLDGHVAIRPLPDGRWPVPTGAHLREEGGKDATYTVLGGFIDPSLSTFDPIEHRIPPAVADQMDASQRWAIQATGQALQDAGLDAVEDRDRWAVILGNALGGEQRAWTERRMALREVLDALDARDLSDEAREETRAVLEAQLEALPPITEDTMPGELSNVIAGRVCSVFDIGGPARTVDAACASSLAATEQAVGLLRDGAVDVAITGGVDRSMDPAAYAKFSAIGALSKDGSFPFDQKASGFVMGEGCGILVLKRLGDAVADGDRIYATIHGVGSSSDGKGKGITAPNPAGQVRAIRSALEDAAWDPASLGLIEAHGTGTPVGDPAEAETLEHILGGADPGTVALGSVKGNIGHLKAAAGAAGLIKAALAVHHATLPPTVVDQPTDQVDWRTSPLALVTEPRPWDDDQRRAGVSAFGFGGTNSHIVLAAPPGSQPEPSTPEPTTQANAKPQPKAEGLGLRRVSAADRQGLAAQLDQPPGTWTYDAEDPVRLAVSEEADLATAKQVLAGDLPAELALSKGIALAEGEPGKLGLVFPGQGSQYPGMVLDLAQAYPAAAEVLAEADQVLTPLIGQPLSEILALQGEAGLKALTPTEVCQPAVLTCDIAILRILEELGVEPDVVAGHSLGEYAALVAADVLSFEDALHAVSARGREMADVEVDDPGGLIAVRADREQAETLIDGLEAWPANVNGPEQTVLAATTQALGIIEDRADEAGIQASRLPVSAAFHSPIVAPATEPLGRVLGKIPVDPPRVPVISNVTAEPYPGDPAAIRDLLARQVAAPVEWVATMAAFRDRGVDLIIEAGPKRVLANLAKANLPDTPAAPTAHPRAGAQATLDQALLLLAAHGHLDTDDPAPAQPEAPTPSAKASATADHRALSPTPDQAQPTADAQPRASAPAKVVVSGVSVGLPGHPDPFAPGQVEALLDGGNRIDPVPDHLKQAMASMGITRLVKDDQQGPHLAPIDAPDQVVQLAGRLGPVDLAEYDVTEDWVEHTDATAELALVAALNALTDAKIPLVRETRETSTGATLEDGWVLPEPLQAETGVILASAFPGYDSLVTRLQDQAHQAVHQGASPQVLVDAINRLSEHIDDPAGTQALMDWAAETHLGQPQPTARTPTGDDGTDQGQDSGFPRGFLFQALAMGHAQAAQLLRARGPNLQVNAACASTTAAISLAQDWIQTGRCQRVIVVGADVAGNDALLPLVGAGFLSAGAATTSDRVEEAALPFDQRRNGMLIGSGALALVLETDQAARDRGLEPLAELVDAHLANSAFHGARLEPDHVAETVTTFLDRARRTLDLSRQALAEDLVFVSHEPATPVRGGSAQAEVQALRSALDEAAADVLISNTKGLTGHAMGAGIEDAMAVELLRHRRAPPVANLEQPDPGFQDLTFSTGEPTDRCLSLRFAAGFGSQVALALFLRTTDRPGALDEARFDAWVEQAIGQDVTIQTQDRLLRAVRSTEAGSRPAGPGPKRTTPQATASTRSNGHATTPASPPTPQADARTSGDQTQDTPGPAPGVTQDQVVALLTELVSQRTGYPTDVIEPGMDLEADLGVDTVKQAEVLAQARKELDIPPIEGLSLSDVPTLQQAAELLAEHTSGASTPTEDADEETRTDEGPPEAIADEPVPVPADGDATATPAATDTGAVVALLTELVSQRTGYPTDVIEPGMDLEADLGVDTVKQAEVLAQARKELDIPPIEGLSLSDVPTLQQAAELLAQHAPQAATGPAEPGTGEGSGSEPATASPESGDDGPSPIRVHGLTATPAPVGDRLPEGTTVLPDDRLSDGLRRALDAAGARLVDERGTDGQAADLAVLVLAPTEDRDAVVDDLSDLLTDLQALPETTRAVVLAPADHPAATGIGPLCATLREEQRSARAILVEPRTPADRVADEVLTELDVTVRLGSTTRRTPATVPGPEPTPLSLDPGTVVLAPGGLGAAVHPCLAALAQEHDVRLAILGRSPAEDPGVDPDDEDAVADLRQRLLYEARGQGQVTPAEIEAQVQATVKQARRARALDELKEHAEVLYERVDATDVQALQAAVDKIARIWDVPGMVVHGTGLDRSRGFTKKTRDEMRQVLAAKLVPALELTAQLPEAHHVAFGSVAGVHGNPGQADYALANGCLTRLMEAVSGTVVHWTAWDAAGGMADDESVRTMLEAREVTYLDVDDGARLFLDHAGRPGAFVVSDRTPEAPQTPCAPEDDGTSAARIDLTGQEPFLVDHQVGDRPLFPGVRHLQAMVEAAASRPEAARPAGLSTIRFAKPLYVTEPTTVQVTVQDGQAATVCQGTERATARLGPGPGTKPVEPAADDELVDAQRWDPATIYAELFHGPSFQPLIEAHAADAVATATADLACGGAAPWAMALEAAMQTAGLSEAARDRSALPIGLESLEIGPDPTDGRARITVRRTGTDALGSTWDAEVHVGETLVVAARAIRLQRVAAIPRLLDGLAELDLPEGLRLATQPVAPFEPRDPRAKQEAEHGAGQAAAEDALQQVHGRPVGVQRTDEGQPVPIDAPGGVSITHGHGLALATADPERSVGVDIEAIEGRDAAWFEQTFTAEEQDLLAGTCLDAATGGTVGWTLKEAAAKAIGTGLTVPFEALTIAEAGDGTARLDTPEGAVEARWTTVEGLAVAVAWPVA